MKYNITIDVDLEQVSDSANITSLLSGVITSRLLNSPGVIGVTVEEISSQDEESPESDA